MNGRLIIIGVLLLCIAALIVNIVAFTPEQPVVTNFEECVAAGYPVMESMPRQCRDSAGTLHVEEIALPVETTTIIEPTLTPQDAQAIATVAPVCTTEGTVGAFETYNPNSGTWWFTLDADKNGCSPACVVYDQTKEVEVNWRCTGLRQ